MINKTIAFLVLILCSLPVDAQSNKEWKLKRDRDGIIVYTRAVDWSRYNEYKVETEVEGTIDRFYSLFKDFEVYKDLFRDVKSIKVHFDQPDRHITYLANRIPFPAKDRDLVLDNRFSYEEESKLLMIDINCVNEYYVPSKRHIQIETCHGFWKVWQISDNRLHIIHQFIADPKGSIPAFIVNIKTIQNPFKTMMAVRDLIQSQKYDNKSLFLNFLQNTRQ